MSRCLVMWGHLHVLMELSLVIPRKVESSASVPIFPRMLIFSGKTLKLLPILLPAFVILSSVGGSNPFFSHGKFELNNVV